MKKLYSTVMLALLIVNMLTLAFNVQPAKASGTIYIRADGSVEGTTQISSVNNITYMFTGNIYDSIVVERDSIILDGQGYLLNGTGSGYGITLSGRNNVTLKNIEINAFQSGVRLWLSSNNTISGNTITNNDGGVSLLFLSNNNNISGNSFVNDGLYIWESFGNVVVDNLVNGKPLVYLEDASDLVVEDAGQVILVNCNRIRVENLSLANTDVGVQLWNTNDTTITGNTITNNSNGVDIWDSSNNTVSGNTITSNGHGGGVYLASVSNNTISGNNITNNWWGVVIAAASNNTISGNNITMNDGCGIFFMTKSSRPNSNNTIISGNIIANNGKGALVRYSSNTTISGNSFVNDGLYISNTFGNVVVDNLVNGKPLVYLEDGSDLVVEDAGQVILINCNRIRVENLSPANTDVAVQLWNTNDTIITGNNITNNESDGVYLYFSSNNTVSGNNITNNDGNGVYLSHAFNNTISGNNITANDDYGIFLISSSNNNTISGNSITENHAGILHHESSSSTIFRNNIRANSFGIGFDASSNNTVFGNNITANSVLGISLSRSFNNTIYHNNFINNFQFLLTSSANNTWDNGCEGNFWSNYAGSDSDGDGIGDTPYVIDGDNQDQYPLMNPYWNPSDINHDLIVDIFDVVRAAGAYDSTPSDPEWNPHCDIAEEYGIIDIFDIVTIAMSYGEEYVP